MPDTKGKPVSVALARLNPLDYPTLSTSAFKILCRLVVLTKKGAQTCIFNNDQTDALGISERTATRVFKQLSDHGFIQVEYKTSPLGPNSRFVTLNTARVKCDEADTPAAAPKADAADTSVSANAANTAAPATTLYTASTPVIAPAATVIATPQSLLCNQPSDEEDAKYFAPRCFSTEVWSKLIETDPSDPLVRRYARYQARRLIVPNTAQMLCHTNLYHFDFAEPLAAMGYGPIRFGADPNPTTEVDFSEFAEYMSGANATAEPLRYCRKVFAPWLEKYFRFCIMSEISYYSDQLFSKPEECPRLNMQNIKLFFSSHQKGFFPTVMAPIFGLDYVDVDGADKDHWFCSEALWRSISSRYISRPNQSPVPYLTKCVIRQFIDAIADPPMYGAAFIAFEKQFMNFAVGQRWNSDAILALKKDELVTKHYYPLPLNQLLETDSTSIMFRPSYPMFLMRKVYMTYHVAGLFEWYHESCLKHHRQLLEMAATDPDVKMQWDAFKAFHCHDYPFLNKLEAANV